MDKIEIINRIGYIRVRAKLTQKALSAAIELNPSYINRLESKKDFLPSLEVLMKIIEACGTTAEEFFYSDMSAYPQDRLFIEKVKSNPKITELLYCDSQLLNIFTTLNERAKPLDKKDLDSLKK